MIWLEIIVGFAVPFAWGLWELHALKRESKDGVAKDRD